MQGTKQALGRKLEGRDETRENQNGHPQQPSLTPDEPPNPGLLEAARTKEEILIE
jgi:hypothetical protein